MWSTSSRGGWPSEFLFYESTCSCPFFFFFGLSDFFLVICKNYIFCIPMWDICWTDYLRLILWFPLHSSAGSFDKPFRILMQCASNIYIINISLSFLCGQCLNKMCETSVEEPVPTWRPFSLLSFGIGFVIVPWPFTIHLTLISWWWVMVHFCFQKGSRRPGSSLFSFGFGAHPLL